MTNFIKLMIHDFKPEIVIMNLLGISYKIVRRCLFFFTMSLVLIGLFLGILSGILVSSFMVVHIMKSVENIQVMFDVFPFRIMFGSVISYFLLFILMLLPIFRNIKKFTPNRVMQISNEGFQSKSPKKTNHLFTAKSKKFIGKIAKNNIRSNMKSIILTEIGIGLSIFIFVVGLFFLKINLKVFGHDTYMDYKVSFQSEFDMTDLMIEEKAQIYHQLLTMSEICNIYPTYKGINNVEIEKRVLSESHMRYLNENTTTNLALQLGNQKSISIPVTILGYTEKQLEEIYSINKLPNAKLADNEAIVLNQTIPFRGDQGFPLFFKNNDVIDLNLEAYEESSKTKTDFKIASVINELDIYPNDMYHMVCFIVNENTYKEWIGTEVPDEFYVKILSSDKEDGESIKKLLTGKNFLTLTIPIEDEMLIMESERILKSVIILFFTCFTLCASISLASTLYLRIYTREKEYAMMQAIGMTMKQLQYIVCYEIFWVFIIGTLVAGVLSYIGTYFMQVSLIEDAGAYLYKFPIEIYIESIFFALIVLFFSSIPIFNKISKMNIVATLKSTE